MPGQYMFACNQLNILLYILYRGEVSGNLYTETIGEKGSLLNRMFRQQTYEGNKKPQGVRYDDAVLKSFS